MGNTENRIIKECQLYYEKNPHSYETPKGLALKLGRDVTLVEDALMTLKKQHVLQSQTSSDRLETIYFLVNSLEGLKMETAQDDLPPKKHIEELTKREREVYRLLFLGYSNDDISQKLHISNHTTKNHVSNIYRKLLVTNRVELLTKYKSGI